MPYIDTEEVKKKRQEIKKAFPSFKFSITKRNHSEISVAILEAPFNMLTQEREHEQVNQYYIDRDYKAFPEVMDALKKIYEIVALGNRTLFVDGDYGSVPKFYVSIEIGKWDKPFKVSA